VKPWRRRSLEIGAGVFVIIGAVIWLSGGCEEKIPPGDMGAATQAPAPDARFAEVRSSEGPVFEWASGTIASARHTAVSSRIMARIEEVRVRAGSEVSEGDVLIVFDSRDLEARARETEESLRGARARLSLARSDGERLEKLFAEGIATQQQRDKALSDLKVAESETQSLERRLEEERATLSHAVITSPVSGRVVDRLAEPGDTPVPGRPLLRIYDPGALRVEIPVRETLAVRLRVGEPLRVELAALGERVDGSIDEIVPFAEPGARTLLVKVRLAANPDLYAGMFARALIPAGRRDRLLVPASAVERIGQLSFVEALTKDGRLERRLVTTGETEDPGIVEALSGLKEGEKVRLPRAASAPGEPAGAS